MTSENNNNKYTPKVEHTLKGWHRDAITSVSFCPTQNVLVNRHARHGNRKERSSQLASASLDGTITLWSFFSNPADISGSTDNDQKANGDQVRPSK